MAYASWSVVYGEQPSAAKWNILGSNDASFNDGTGIADGAILPEHLKNGSSTLNTWDWDTWTPTLSGRFTNGDWTKNAKYIRVGDIVFFKLNLIATDSTPMAGGSAEAIFSLPATSVALTGNSFYHISTIGRILDFGTAAYLAFAELDSTTTARVRYIDTAAAANASQVAITSTAPFTWTTSDEISVQGFYEAA